MAKISATKYQTRYEFIKDVKEFDMAKFIEDFKIIPISTVRSFDYWEDQLDILNNLILLCKEEHALLKRIKFTQTSTPGMENKGIVALQRERDQLGTKHIYVKQRKIGIPIDKYETKYKRKNK